MDEHRATQRAPARRKRASKGQVRAFAWTASALSFIGAFATLTVSPKPAEGAVPAAPKVTKKRPVVVVVTKKIVYAAPTARPVAASSGGVHYVYSAAAPAAAPPPAAVSCGSTPC